jgi:cyclophilin family peptidyl-prolyl cis-trans isomerase
MMASGLRPKIYLLLCVLGLLLEGTWILLHAPVTCFHCHKALSVPSHELPNELCQACADELRQTLGAGGARQSATIRPPLIGYTPPYPIEPANPCVVLETTRGEVMVELFEKRAPISTANFLSYVRGGHYDGIIFHRLEDYLCVSGRFRGGYNGQPAVIIPQSPPIKSESDDGLDNRVGTLSLPRQDSDANSATSDFFFNLIDNPSYNRRGSAPNEAGYAVFGQIVKGFEVVDSLRFLPLSPTPIGGSDKAPREAVLVRRAYVAEPQTLGSVAGLGSRTQTGR